MDTLDGSARARLTRLLARRRNRILLAVGAVLLLLRVALPFVLRPILVARADEALVGRIELEDLDLSLLRGGVTLHGFSVHTDERPSTAPALFEAKRLWTQISWLALLARTLEVEEFELEGFSVRLDRFEDGLLLPKPIPSPAPETREAPADAAPAAFTWSVAADAVSLREGRIELRDHTVKGEPQHFALGIEDLSARELAIRSDPAEGEPGRISIQAQLDEGSVALDSWIEQSAAGLDVRSTLVLDDLPIDKLRAYLPMFDWDELSGHLDASLEHRYAAGGAHELKGRAALADVVVGVPRFAEPALAWSELEVVVDRIDLVKREAVIASVASTGARVIVDPRAPSPLALLAPPETEPPEAAAASASAAPAPAADPADESPLPAPTDEGSTAGSPAFRWLVAKASLRDAVVDLRGAAEPVAVRVQAELAALSSAPDTRTPLALSLATDEGTLTLVGELSPRPIAFAGKLAIEDLALPPLAAQVDAPALHWLRAGTLRANLVLALAEDLRASGTLGLAGLDLKESKTAKQFGVEWRDLDLALSSLRFPGVLGPAPTGAARRLDVQLARLRLSEPRFVLTRDAHGLVLPPLSANGDGGAPRSSEGPRAAGKAQAEGAGATGPNATPVPPARVAGDAAPITVSLAIADVRIEGGRGQLADRAVEPYYRGRIEALDVHATGIRWPANEVDSIELTLKGLRGAQLSLAGAIGTDRSRLEGSLVELPLQQFNPYLGSTGYSLREGALSLESKARIQPDRFKADSRVVVSALDVGGAAGESAFQENFGIPLSVALGLLKDLDGRISLGVPVDGPRDEVKLGLGRIVGQALRKALVGALASPLKLLGAVTRDGKVASLAPQPIAFPTGESALGSAAEERIEELASLLAASPAIALALTGQTSADDERILGERALLAELEADRGVRAFANLGELGTRRAVRDHLRRKLAGADPAPLAEAEARWLEAQLAASSPMARALEELANERAGRVRDALASEHGIVATRLVVRAPSTDPPAPEAGVAVALDTLGAARKARAGSGSPTAGSAAP